MLCTIKVAKLKPVMKASKPARCPPQFKEVDEEEALSLSFSHEVAQGCVLGGFGTVIGTALYAGESDVSPLLLLVFISIFSTFSPVGGLLCRFLFRSFLVVFASFAKTT